MSSNRDCHAYLKSHSDHPEYGEYLFCPVCHLNKTFICRTLISAMRVMGKPDYYQKRAELTGMPNYPDGAIE